MGIKMMRQYLSSIALRASSAASLDKIIISQSLLHLRANQKLRSVEFLSQVEFRGFSQWGEDGILNWMIEKIPGIPPAFIEFGVENYRESNTRLLLWLRNWRGLVIDGSERNIEDIRRQDVSWRFDLQSICEFINRDNINNLIASAGMANEVGVLSIDIDGNDYWVWEAINVVKPAIVVCEYNAVFGDLKAITVPYDPNFQITRAHYSNLYFGASIRAIAELGKKKGYQLVGTNSNGCNAFFVREDCAAAVLSSVGSVKVYPSRLRSSRNEKGELAFLRGAERAELIKNLPVFDIVTGRNMTLAECGELNSAEWSGCI